MHIHSAQIPFGIKPKPAPTGQNEPREPIAPKTRTNEAKVAAANEPRAEQLPQAARELKPLTDFTKQDFRTNTYLNIAHYDQDYPLIDVYA